MSKPISITDECDALLEKNCVKDEQGQREETYSNQIIRLLKRSEAK